MDSKRIGRLEDAAIEKARPIMNATFSFLKAMPTAMAIERRAAVAALEAKISRRSRGCPRAMTAA
jgi:hypothetical protein